MDLETSHLTLYGLYFVQGLFFSYTRLAFTGTIDCKFIKWWAWLESGISLG